MSTDAIVTPESSTERTPAQRLQDVRDSIAGVPANILTLGSEPTRLLDAGLGALVLFSYGLTGTLPLGVVVLAALLALSITRRPRFDLGQLGWVIGLLWVALAYASAISMMSPDLSQQGWARRAVRLVAVVVFLTVLVSGRLHYPSIIRGAGIGLLGNAALFFAGMAPANYGEFLSGYMLDKNQAGLVYAVVTILLLGVLRQTREQIVVVVVFSGLVWLTGSRTSMAALMFGLVWFFARPRLAPFARLCLGAAIAYAVPRIEQTFSQTGDFSDRVGSDLLRGRIDAASLVKLQEAPWWGDGLGEAWVTIPTGDYFFHNSYWGLLVEAGWPFAIALIGVLVVVGMRPFQRLAPPSTLALSGEAGVVALLVCGLRLGEVFGTTTWTLVLAAGLIGGLQIAAAADTTATGAAADAAGGAADVTRAP